MNNPTQSAFNPDAELRGRRSLAGQLTVVLLIILAILLALYWVLTKPPAAIDAAKTPGIDLIFSIFGPSKGDYLDRPDDATVDARGNIYIADSGKHRLLVFNSRGDFIRKIGKEGVGKGELKFPLGVAVDDQGNVYTSTTALGKIMVFGPTGKFLREFGISKDHDNENPIKLRIKGKLLYAAASGRIVVMDLKGKVLRKWGAFGKGLSQFAYPNGLDIGKDGKVYVSDSNNMRVQIFNDKGRLIAYKGSPPKDLNDANRIFGLNMGLALDDEGRVFVVDAFHGSIHIFDKDGEEMGEIGSDGTGDGQLHVPAGITHVGGDRFLVADKWNNRVQMVALTPRGATSAAARRSSLTWLLWSLLALLLLAVAYAVRRLTAGRRRPAPGIGGPGPDPRLL